MAVMPGIVHLVDDEVPVLHALTEILAGEGLSVRPFSSAEAFLAACTPESSGCVVLDMNLPSLDGLQVQRLLRERDIDLPVIFLTGYGDIPLTVQAMKSGAVDFLQKPASPEVLIEHVRAALAQDEGRRAARLQRFSARRRLEQLSVRELEVLDCVLAGKTAKLIARELGISPRTVEAHRKHIFSKTGSSNLIELGELSRLAGRGAVSG